jgi:hypothetical protein
MPCGCGGTGGPVKWVFTDPNGKVTIYSAQIQAQVAKIKAGGGTITERKG